MVGWWRLSRNRNKSELSSRCQPLNHEETGPTSNCALYHGEVVRPGPTNTGFVTVMAESSTAKEQRNGVGNVIALTFLVIASTIWRRSHLQRRERGNF